MRDDAGLSSQIGARQMRSMPVFFINLDHRKDRRVHAEDLWRNQFRMQRVTRVPGIVDDPPFRGCTRAHLRALDMIDAAAPDAPYVILAEDDLVFLPGKGPDDVLQRASEALCRLPDLNVLFLTASLKHFRPTAVDGVVKLRWRGALAMPGMIVRREYLPVLRRIYLKALRKQVPHDRLTRRIQGRHAWYLLWPHLMHQAQGYSDIERRHVLYGYLDEKGRQARTEVSSG